MRYILSINIFKLTIVLAILMYISILFSCKTEENYINKTPDFLKQDNSVPEVFRVLIVSDSYKVSQMKFGDQIKRVIDEEGDSNMSKKLKEYDKIDEVCDATLTVWLYPESGKLMKIRPKELASIAEVNSFIVEDMKRWNFEFSKDTTSLNVFDVKYRVILRKIQSDEEIMKEVIEKNKKASKIED